MADMVEETKSVISDDEAALEEPLEHGLRPKTELEVETDQLPPPILDVIDELLILAFEALSYDADEPQRRRKQWAFSVEELEKKTSDPTAMAYLKGGLYDLYDVADCIRRERSGKYTDS